MSILQSRGDTEITITSQLADRSIPPDMQALELIYILENTRHCTQRHVIPKAIHIPHPDQISPREAAYFGVMPEPGNRLRITLHAQDAALPLVMKDPDQWAGMAGASQTAPNTLNTRRPTALRVRSALVELLPAGFSTVSEVASHLHVSARTLQRQLTGEGVSFQTVLDETRCELALNYLQRGDISIDEISYLLAYSAPNSFYRAFQNWTGMTPQQARSAA
jgi:AraC-like DNA-binding protein